MIHLKVLAVALVMAFLFILLISSISAGRDIDGRSAQMTDEQRDWVRGLKNHRDVPCCEETEGMDIPYRITQDGKVEVKFENKWLPVPPDAMLNVPNKLGVARAWFARGPEGAIAVRCFLGGPMI